jgi:hypothetical protein
MVAVAMASLPQLSLTPIGSIGSIPLPPPSTTTTVDEDMALGPPIHWIIFFVVDVIGLVPLINLLNGLRLGGIYPLFI